MTDQNKENGPREFKAAWAADEDWKANNPKPSAHDEGGWALKQFNKIGARFDREASRTEVDRLPWKDRLKRLPICTLRAIPLVTSLTATYWIVVFISVLLSSNDVLFMKSSALWLEVVYLSALLAVFLGYREARYPEGILKPSFKHLLNYCWSNWFWLLPAIGIISSIGIEYDANSDPISIQIFMYIVFVLAAFWTIDLTAYKPIKRDETK